MRNQFYFSSLLHLFFFYKIYFKNIIPLIILLFAFFTQTSDQTLSEPIASDCYSNDRSCLNATEEKKSKDDTVDCSLYPYHEQCLSENDDGWPSIFVDCSLNPEHEQCLPNEMSTRAKRKAELDDLPSVLDTAGFDNHPLSDNNIELEQTKKNIETLKPMVQMVVYQELKKNPNIYYYFEYASRGKKGIESFEDLQSAGRKERDNQYLDSNVSISASMGVFSVGMNVPDVNQLEEVQYQRHRESFLESQEEFSYLSQRSKQITDIMFLCGTGSIHFDCPAFDDYFKNTQIDSSELKESFKKALEYAQQHSSRWPISTDPESVFLNNPNEVNTVLAMQNARNSEDFGNALHNIENQLDQVQNNAEKQNDDILVALNTRIQNLQDQLDHHQQELSSNTQLTLAEIKQNLQTQNTQVNAIKETQKQKELYEHKKQMNQYLAYAEAAIAVAQVLNAPPEIITMGKAMGIGIKMFDAAKSMLISGALDPTGITVIAQGASAIISIIANPPTPEEIMIDKLNEIITIQQEILNQLLIMDKKINHLGLQLESALGTILNQFKELGDISSQNHKEIIDKLDNIQTSLNYGFDFISDKIDVQTHDKLQRQAQGLYQLHSFFPNSLSQQDLLFCRLDFEKCTDTGKIYLQKVKTQLSQMSAYSTDITEQPSLQRNIDFSSIPLTDITELFNRDVTDRWEIFEPIRQWLNTQINNSKIIPQRMTSLFDLKNDVNIEEIPPFPNIGYPYFQDENFFEAVQLAKTLPIEYDVYSNPTHNTNIDQICQYSQKIQHTSQIMRENLHKAWLVYWLYSQTVQEQLIQSFRRHLNQYGLLDIQKNIKQAIYVVKNHINLAFFLLDDWEELPEHLNELTPLNKCSRAEILLRLARTYSLNPPQNFINFVQRSCQTIDSGYNIGSINSYSGDVLSYFSHCSGDKYIDPDKHIGPNSSPHSFYFYSQPVQTIIGSDRKCYSWNQYNPEIRHAYLDLRQYKNVLPSNFFSNFDHYVNKRIQDQIDNNNIALIGWGYWKLGNWEQTHEIQSKCAEWYSTSREGLCVLKNKSTSLSCLFGKLDYLPDHRICVSYKPTRIKRLRHPLNHNKTLITPNKSAFIQANNDHWKIPLKQLYKKILEDLNRNDLLTNWMRAQLAFDTLARGAYGNLIEHSSSLSSLKTVLSDLSILEPPDIIFYNNKKPLKQTEREKIIQFLRDIESNPDRQNNVHWTSKALRPQCETQNDRIAFTMHQTKLITNTLETKQENFSEDTYHKALNTLQNIRDNALNNRQAIPINKTKFLRYITQINDFANTYDKEDQDRLHQLHIQEAFNFFLSSHPNRNSLANMKNNIPDPIPDFYAYTDQWVLPLCHKVENDSIKSVEGSPAHSIVYHFSDCMMEGYDNCLFNTHEVKISLENTVLSRSDIVPVIPLPPETVWSKEPVGMGFPRLRKQAFLTASQLPHFQPKNCTLN